MQAITIFGEKTTPGYGLQTALLCVTSENSRGVMGRSSARFMSFGDPVLQHVWVEPYSKTGIVVCSAGTEYLLENTMLLLYSIM
jgi:hypothetical protein